MPFELEPVDPLVRLRRQHWALTYVLPVAVLLCGYFGYAIYASFPDPPREYERVHEHVPLAEGGVLVLREHGTERDPDVHFWVERRELDGHVAWRIYVSEPSSWSPSFLELPRISVVDDTFVLVFDELVAGYDTVTGRQLWARHFPIRSGGVLPRLTIVAGDGVLFVHREVFEHEITTALDPRSGAVRGQVRGNGQPDAIVGSRLVLRHHAVRVVDAWGFERPLGAAGSDVVTCALGEDLVYELVPFDEQQPSRIGVVGARGGDPQLARAASMPYRSRLTACGTHGRLLVVRRDGEGSSPDHLIGIAPDGSVSFDLELGYARNDDRYLRAYVAPASAPLPRFVLDRDATGTLVMIDLVQGEIAWKRTAPDEYEAFIVRAGHHWIWSDGRGIVASFDGRTGRLVRALAFDQARPIERWHVTSSGRLWVTADGDRFGMLSPRLDGVLPAELGARDVTTSLREWLER